MQIPIISATILAPLRSNIASAATTRTLHIGVLQRALVFLTTLSRLNAGAWMDWLLITAAGVILFSLVEAWLAALIVSGQVKALQRVFPAPRNLVRSHAA